MVDDTVGGFRVSPSESGTMRSQEVARRAAAADAQRRREEEARWRSLNEAEQQRQEAERKRIQAQREERCAREQRERAAQESRRRQEQADQEARRQRERSRNVNGKNAQAKSAEKGDFSFGFAILGFLLGAGLAASRVSSVEEMWVPVVAAGLAGAGFLGKFYKLVIALLVLGGVGLAVLSWASSS